ncbi:MAG: hypothetical protein DDG59_14500 [Anaerolineae bacterium]|nr:MAG: hypothetical protein DDG59_14500 [Anaerolineae bacterium]
MLKNIFFMVIGATIVVLVFGVTGIVFAQSQPPNNAPSGWRGRWNNSGMMGRWSQGAQDGWMHDYLIAAIAPKLGLSVEALESQLTAGKTLWQIAQEKGLTLEQFQTELLEAKKEALSKMVADGVITQAQADWMLSRMNWMFQNGRGFGFGSGPCHGGSWGGQRGRWAPIPTPGSGS